MFIPGSLCFLMCLTEYSNFSSTINLLLSDLLFSTIHLVKHSRPISFNIISFHAITGFILFKTRSAFIMSEANSSSHSYNTRYSSTIATSASTSTSTNPVPRRKGRPFHAPKTAAVKARYVFRPYFDCTLVQFILTFSSQNAA